MNEKKFNCLPAGIDLSTRLRWTGIRLKMWWSVWCCCHVFLVSDSLENLHRRIRSTLRSQTAALFQSVFFQVCQSACASGGVMLKSSTIWKVRITRYWILVIAATLLQTDSFIAWAVYRVVVYTPLLSQLFLQLANHKWWAPLAGPMAVIKSFNQGQAVISSLAFGGHIVGECRSAFNHIFHQEGLE